MRQTNISEIQLSENEIAAALRVLRSGQVGQGKECETFEREFAIQVGAAYAITCSSVPAAWHLAYMALLEAGDEVLVPSFTSVATVSMVTMTGANPVCCDIDPETFLIDLADAEKRVTPRTKAIAAVHLFGNVCNVSAVLEFAQKHGLMVVWDATQAHGSTFGGREVGALGDFVCYSLYPSETMLVGEGGIVCTPHQEYAELLRYLRSYGQTGKCSHIMFGLNYRMNEVKAAIGRQQLMRLDDMLTIRRRNAEILDFGISAIPGIKPQKITPHTEHAWHQFCVIVDPEHFGCDRNGLAKTLKARGIMTGVPDPRAVHQQPIFEQLYGTFTLPNTNKVSANILALPVHHGLTEDDMHNFIEALEDCYAEKQPGQPALWTDRLDGIRSTAS